MRPQSFLAGSGKLTPPGAAAPTGSGVPTSAGRKPPVRPRLSPAGASPMRAGALATTPLAPPARLSPVNSDGLAGGGLCSLASRRSSAGQEAAEAHVRAETNAAPPTVAPACTPPTADLPVPSTQLLTRALLQRPRPAPVVAPPLHPSPLPAVPASTADGTAAGEKRVRPVMSASTVSVASGASPAAKRVANDMGPRSCTVDGGAPLEEEVDVEEFESRNLDCDGAAVHAGAGVRLSATADAVLGTFGEGFGRTVMGAHATQAGRGLDDDGDSSDACRIGDDLAESPMLRTQILTDEVLRDWTECEDLELVLSFEVRLDAEALMGIHEMSRLLPRLAALRLSRSNIPKIRLLGTRYTQLQRLWINNCRVEDLRGLGACAPQLVELYASFNNITDLTPLLDVSATLEVLDVEANRLANVAGLAFVLPSLSAVTALTLSGNDVVFERAEVARALADLRADLGITTRVVVGAENEEWHLDDLSEPCAVTGTDGGGAHVFVEWVQLLMPQLQTLDDVPLAVRSDAMSHSRRLASAGERAEGVGAAADAVHASPSAAHTLATSRGALGSRCSLTTSTADPAAIHTAATSTVGRPRSVYADPTDAALSAELRLLQECVRANECYHDRLSWTLERQHSELYARPSTACASGARRRLGSSSGSRLGSASVSRAAGAEAREVGSARSDLTTGGVLAGSAMASLRRRLQQQRPARRLSSPSHGTTEEAGAGVGRAASPILTTSAASTVGDDLHTPRARASTQSDSAEGWAVADAAAALGGVLSEDEDEAAWDVYKALVARGRYPSAGSSRSIHTHSSSSSSGGGAGGARLGAGATASASASASAVNAFANTRYRQLYSKYFPDEADTLGDSLVRGVGEGAAVAAAAAAGGRGSVTVAAAAAAEEAEDDAAMNALVKKEVTRARAHMAALADAEADANGFRSSRPATSAWGRALSASERAVAPQVVLTQVDVLELSHE